MHTIAEASPLRDTFLEAMRRLPSGVVLVMTRVNGRAWGLTVSSCCSVSVEPPMLLISVASTTATAASIQEQQRFAVAILDQDRIDVARFGSAKGAPKFIDELCDHAVPGTPALRQCTAQLECELAESLSVADHTIFIGRVVNGSTAGRSPDERPLVYYDRQYIDVSQIKLDQEAS